MKPLLILNDIHLGVVRQAGTTPATQVALRSSLQSFLADFIKQHHDKDLCLLGDIFDAFTVEIGEVLACCRTLAEWLKSSSGDLILAAGNHDIGIRNDRLSSFDVLCEILVGRFPSRVHTVREGLRSFGNIHIIPHCMNQNLFDLEMEKARTLEPGFLLLHANVDNGFCENSDHSLNISGEWLARLTRKHTILCAHEHQHRTFSVDENANKVFVLGNQIPSSISDCLSHGVAQKDGSKFAHVIHEDSQIEAIPTWQRQGDFEQLDWQDLAETSARFVRITGTATAAEASNVISAIAKYRQGSSALIITNGVRIEGIAGMDELAEHTFESVKSFDVLQALCDLLEPREVIAVKKLLEEN